MMKSEQYLQKVVNRDFPGYAWTTEDVMKAARAAVYAHESGKQRKKDAKWDAEVLKGLQAARRVLARAARG